MSNQTNLTCINCQRTEDELPLTEWRMAGNAFWVCPECLPLLIHRRAEVMPRWNLAGRVTPSTGGRDA
jgi:hypothetical protein